MQHRLLNINDLSDEEYNYYYSLMSPQKKRRVERFRFPDDKKRTVAGELLARKMIADFCKVNAEDIVFNQNEYSKPYAEKLNVEFNISHSYELVICAISENAIGVDIEKIRDIDDKVMAYVCTREEYAYLNEKGIEKEEKLKRFFEIWTFKEAYFKWKGTGLTDLKSISFFDETINCFNRSELFGEYMISIYNPPKTDKTE